jgi:hypothetical protein
MISGIQYFGPSHLPAAAEKGWKVTKVTKKRETAKLRSSGEAPMSFVKPLKQSTCVRTRPDSTSTRKDCIRKGLALRLRIPDIAPVQAVEQIQQGQHGQQRKVQLPVDAPVHGPAGLVRREIRVGDGVLAGRLPRRRVRRDCETRNACCRGGPRGLVGWHLGILCHCNSASAVTWERAPALGSRCYLFSFAMRPGQLVA